MKRFPGGFVFYWAALLAACPLSFGSEKPAGVPELPNFDKRGAAGAAVDPAAIALAPEQASVMTQLRGKVKEVRVEIDPITWLVSHIALVRVLLTKSEEKGGAAAATRALPAGDKNRVVKTFVNEHRAHFPSTAPHSPAL